MCSLSYPKIVQTERNSKRKSNFLLDEHPDGVPLIITRYNGSCAGIGTFHTVCVPKVRPYRLEVEYGEVRTVGTPYKLYLIAPALLHNCLICTK